MSEIDLTTITTDDLLQIIPQTETKEWEFKAAAIFEKANFGNFKQKLGKIVSSFANSGGGYLLLGKRDGEDTFDAVPTHEGRTSMEDHLSLVISQCVTPHFREFEIHRVPISGTANSVLVVEFSDSPLAPHQSNADTNYFYRLPGHSVPAPHFHLELLRSRFTKSVVEIGKIEFRLQTSDVREGFSNLNFALAVTVENTSLQSATAWGVQIKSAETDYRWEATRLRASLVDGVCVRGEQEILLPSEKSVVTIHVNGKDQTKSIHPAVDFCDLAGAFEVFLRPITQNYVARDIRFVIERSDIERIRRNIENGIAW